MISFTPCDEIKPFKDVAKSFYFENNDFETEQLKYIFFHGSSQPKKHLFEM